MDWYHSVAHEFVFVQQRAFMEQQAVQNTQALQGMYGYNPLAAVTAAAPGQFRSLTLSGSGSFSRVCAFVCCGCTPKHVH